MTGAERRPVALIMMVSSMSAEPRVHREAPTIAGLGYRVVALGVRTTGKERRHDCVNGLEIRRVELLDMKLLRRIRAMPRRRRRTDAGIVPSGGAPPPGHEPRAWDVRGDIRNLVYWATSTVAFAWQAWRAESDVLHPHDLPPSLAAVVVGRLRRIPIVYESHECWPAQFSDKPMSRFVARRLERLVCRASVLSIAVNDSIADRMEADLRVKRPLVIFNMSALDPVAQIQPAKAPIEVLYHGGVEPGRGVDLLVRAIAMMRSPVRLTVRGSGSGLPAVRQLVEVLGLDAVVQLEDPVPPAEIVRAAARCHVGVIPLERVPAHEYSLPNKLFESMAAGLAIVTSDLPEVARIVTTGELGIVVPFTSRGEHPARLANALDELASDLGRLDRMRDAAAALARSTYSWQAHQARLAAHYPLPSASGG